MRNKRGWVAREVWRVNRGAALGRRLASASFALARTWAALRQRRSFRGRTVLITGGSRGLGLVLARSFADEGARVVICARDPLELERARADLAARGAQVLAVPCDVTRRGHVQDLVRLVDETLGPVDVLVNNAGIIQVGPFESMTLGDFDAAMRIHFYAPLQLIREVLPSMRRRRWGRIINISSIGGKVAVPRLLPYDASKFALTGLSEGLSAELFGAGIRVTTVCPGLMRTGSAHQADFKDWMSRDAGWFTATGVLPGTSMSADRAGRQILAAARRGRSELVLGAPAKLLAKVHGLFPGLVHRAMRGASRLLAKNAKVRHPPNLPGFVTARAERAARKNNELSHAPA